MAAQHPAISAEEFAAATGRIHAEICTVIEGKPQVVAMVVLSLLARGHLLIEDVPGVGKTMLAKALARSVDVSMRRIQFTPDLLPSDVTGASVFDMARRTFEFRPGPVFSHIVLADEINRASPKTQSALLECMAEDQVTVDGQAYPLPEPFMVIATQNPLEMAGTYPLPEPQRDRFLARIAIGYPDAGAEATMLERHGRHEPLRDVRPQVDLTELQQLVAFAQATHLADPVRHYIVALVQATRSSSLLRLGASPRAGLHLIRAVRARAALTGRDHVLPDDVQALAVPVLAHRVLLGQDALAQGHSEAAVIRGLVATVPVPGLAAAR